MAEQNLDVTGALMQTANNAMTGLTTSIPTIVGGLVVLVLAVVFGWILGYFFSEIVKRVLLQVKFEKFLESHRVEDALGKVKISNVLAQLVKYYTIFFVLHLAASMINLSALSTFLSWILFYAPAFLGGIALFAAFALLGEFVREKILELGKDNYVTMGANFAKLFLMFLGALAGLDTIGFNTTIIRESLLKLIEVFGFGIALAVGIAFGLGGQAFAKDLIEEAHGHIRK